MHLRTVSRFTLIMLVTLVLGLGCSFPYRPKLNWFTRPTSTLTLTATPSITPSATPTSTLTPTSTFTATLSPTPTSTDTLTPTATKVLTATKTLSPTPAPTYPSSTPTRPFYGVPGKAQLISPSGLIPQKKPVYMWSVVSDATVYYLLVYPVDEPSIYLIDTWYLSGQVCTGSTCSIQPDARLGYGTYNWLVQTWNAAGFGPWSDVKKFILSPATPTRTPIPTRTPTLTRTPTPTATAVPTLVVLATNNSFGSTRSIAIKSMLGEIYAFLGNGVTLNIWKVTTPMSPSQVSIPLAMPGIVRDITISDDGKYAYIAAQNNGLQVVDISDPALPSLISTETSHQAYGVAVNHHLAYIAQNSSGFRMVDISTPYAPVGLGSYPMHFAYDVAVSSTGAYAYVADGGDGLMVMWVATPTPTASPINTYTPISIPTGKVISQPIPTNTNTPVPPPPTPITITKLSQYKVTGGAAIDVATSGNYAYIAYGNKGLYIVEVMTPAYPIPSGSFGFSGDANAVDIRSNNSYEYVFVAAGTSGLWVFKFNENDPSNPIAVGRYFTSGSANDVAVLGDIVYVANGTEGLIILEFIP